MIEGERSGGVPSPTSVGLSQYPEGEAYYRVLVRRSTTMDVTLTSNQMSDTFQAVVPIGADGFKLDDLLTRGTVQIALYGAIVLIENRVLHWLPARSRPA